MSVASLAAKPAYDPLAVGKGEVKSETFEVRDAKRERTIPIRVYFPDLTHAPAWQVIFDKATHMNFGERDFAGKEQNGDRYHKAILALSTAFWDAHLKGDKAAMKWLKGAGAKSVLAESDVWETNGK